MDILAARRLFTLVLGVNKDDMVLGLSSSLRTAAKSTAKHILILSFFLSKLIMDIVIQKHQSLLHPLNPLLANIALLSNIVEILGIQQLEEIMGELLISLCEMDTILGFGVDHFEVELVRVAEGGLLAHGLETVLFRVIVACTGNIVFFLFEEAEFLAGQGLRALLVVAPVDGVAKR